GLRTSPRDAQGLAARDETREPGSRGRAPASHLSTEPGSVSSDCVLGQVVGEERDDQEDRDGRPDDERDAAEDDQRRARARALRRLVRKLLDLLLDLVDDLFDLLLGAFQRLGPGFEVTRRT